MSGVANVRRTCRTCPAVIAAAGSSDQCRPCQQRSAAIGAALAHVHPAAPRKHDCRTDGHHACQHFAAIYHVFRKWLEDNDWCPSCGVEADDDGPLPHKPGCALWEIVTSEQAAERGAEVSGE